MNPQTLFKPLLEQLELLNQVVSQSPYISRDDRIGIEKEINTLSEMLKDGEMTISQCEKTLTDLDKNAAAKEIASLTTKIGYLNPSSPRLDNLHSLQQQLHEDKISPEEARKNLLNLMQG